MTARARAPASAPTRARLRERARAWPSPARGSPRVLVRPAAEPAGAAAPTRARRPYSWSWAASTRGAVLCTPLLRGGCPRSMQRGEAGCHLYHHNVCVAGSSQRGFVWNFASTLQDARCRGQAEVVLYRYADVDSKRSNRYSFEWRRFEPSLGRRPRVQL